jgi:hypothetical protein
MLSCQPAAGLAAPHPANNANAPASGEDFRENLIASTSVESNQIGLRAGRRPALAVVDHPAQISLTELRLEKLKRSTKA